MVANWLTRSPEASCASSAAAAQLLPAVEHRALHAERLHHLALLADGLGEGVALQRRDASPRVSGRLVSTWLSTVASTSSSMPATARCPR